MAMLTLGSCAPAQGPTAGDPPGPSPSAAAGPGSGNPLINEDFPDPDILQVGGTYYAYATNGNTKNVQIATSTDFVEWTVLEDDAFPVLPSWVIPGKTWAPEVTQIAPGRFVLYFTATNFEPALQCIGTATATDPAGPFTVHGDGMLVCPADQGGAIDAATYTDDGGLHLVWKNDGNCCGLDTWIQTAPLASNGLRFAGPARKLIRQTKPWEGALVEAPTVIPRDSGYVLLYSSNAYSDSRYNIGTASAPALGGPWKKSPGPVLSSDSLDGRYIGPGGQDLVTGPDGQEYLVFHAWDTSITYRAMYAEPVEWDGTRLRFTQSGQQ